jgi:hypothetical protein
MGVENVEMLLLLLAAIGMWRFKFTHVCLRWNMTQSCWQLPRRLRHIPAQANKQ